MADYAHHRRYTRPHERPDIPYAGPIEDRLRTAFVDSYTPVADSLRTPYAAQSMAQYLNGRGSPRARVQATLDNVIDPYLLQAEANMQKLWYPEILPITTVAAAGARLEARSMNKATAHQVKVARRGYRRLSTLSRLRLRPTSAPMFGDASVRHVEAARSLTLDLIQHATRTQRTKIRSLLTQSITDAVNPFVTGARISNVIGLFPRWQNAVDNFFMNLIDAGWSTALAQARARDYHASLLDKRGVMIARTEIMRAMNDGRLAGWQDLVDRGEIEAQSLKEWLPATDACPDCLDIKPVYGIDTAFDTPVGELVQPPAHPHCRCTTLLHPVFADDRASDSNAHALDVATIEAFPEAADLLDRFGPMEGNWR